MIEATTKEISVAVTHVSVQSPELFEGYEGKVTFHFMLDMETNEVSDGGGTLQGDNVLHETRPHNVSAEVKDLSTYIHMNVVRHLKEHASHRIFPAPIDFELEVVRLMIYEFGRAGGKVYANRAASRREQQ